MHSNPKPMKQQLLSLRTSFLSNVRQITFEGLRAGEGYFGFGADADREMVFQSERREDNPFFQIYTLDFETGDTAPGLAWIWQNDLCVVAPRWRPSFVRVDSVRS